MARLNKSEFMNQEWNFDVEVKKEEYDIDSKINFSDNKPSTKPLIVSGLTAEEIELKKNPIKMMRKHPLLATNLIIVTITWIACSFNYFLLNFGVKNLGGNLFLNTSLITFAGLTGKVITIVIRRYVPTRIALII
jgi:hypothetical protein